MVWSLYALLCDESPEISNDSLASELRAYFKDEEDFSLRFELLPFAKIPTLALRWGTWLTRVCYEEGDHVVDDSPHIHLTLGESAPFDLSGIRRRIRLVFGRDDAAEYTDQIIWLIEYVRAIDGVVVFDPQQGDLVT
jgi:hypothetical protein